MNVFSIINAQCIFSVFLKDQQIFFLVKAQDVSLLHIFLLNVAQRLQRTFDPCLIDMKELGMDILMLQALKMGSLVHCK